MQTFYSPAFVPSTAATSVSGDSAALAYAEWLSSRPDLWCVGDDVQREIYALLEDVTQRAA